MSSNGGFGQTLRDRAMAAIDCSPPEAREQTCNGIKARCIGTAHFVPHRTRPPRPFADRKIKARVEQLRVGPTIEDVQHALENAACRPAGPLHDRGGIAALPMSQKIGQQCLAVLEEQVEV